MSMCFSNETPRYGFGAALLLFMGACSKEGPLSPVKGKVLYKNRPAEGARIVFHPLDPVKAGPALPSAIVQADGSFQLATNAPGDGAAPGEYQVAIVWLANDGKVNANAEMKNRLPARYADPKASRLKATIESTATELPPFLLTD